MTIHRTLATALLLTCAAPAAAAAQQSFGPSIEASFGLSTGGGGDFIERNGVAVDAVLALPLGRTSRGTVVAGLTASGNGKPTSDLVCALRPNGTCAGDYPTLLSLGVVAGVQQPLGRNASARILAGPTYFQVVDGKDAFGVQARVDVARPLVLRTAAVLSLRSGLLPRYEGQTLRFASLALGLRIQ